MSTNAEMESSPVLQDELHVTSADVIETKPTDLDAVAKDDASVAFSQENSEEASRPAKCSKLSLLSNTLIPAGGHISNTFNLASGTLGIGIVSMASGFETTGLVLAAILIVICGLLIVFSFYLIGVVCERSPYHSWEAAARGILFRGADYFIAGVLIFFMIGTMIGYVVSVHDLLSGFLNHDSVNPFLKTDNGHRLLTATVWFFGMLSLSIPRRVSSLRYFSVIGVTLILYFVVCVVVNSCRNGLPHMHEMKLFSTGMDAVNGLTLFIFGFLANGLAYRLFLESKHRTAGNLARDSGCSVTLVAILYYIVGFFGYADIGPTISGSIFRYYNIYENPMMMVAFVGIILKVCVAYALCNQACRLPIYYCLHRDIDRSPFWMTLLITIIINLVALVLGLFIPDINIVFNLLGSLCGGILGFLFPALYVFYLGGWTVKNVGWWRVGATYLLLCAGVVAIVFGTSASVYGIVLTYG